jgi:hypothetical protein
MQPHDEVEFFAFAERALDWVWHPNDLQEVDEYAETSGIVGFQSIALPQGLVAAGFFANLILLDFDRTLRDQFSIPITPGVILEDACRYSDDLRLVVRVDEMFPVENLEILMADWLAGILADSAPGLEVSREKTHAASLSESRRPLVRQSGKMRRIQSAVSGGFDAEGGEDILDAVQGLIRSQLAFSEERGTGTPWPFSPVPDVRDATVERFAAARYRSTYRSLRPLLEPSNQPSDQDETPETGQAPLGDLEPIDVRQAARTRADLDDDAKAFALGLVENWIHNPSNVRLLRIGLDIWPASDVLESVLGLLRPYSETARLNRSARAVAMYCLAELFRAGATETGHVEDRDSLSDLVNLAAYREVLKSEAIRLLSLNRSRLPWYLIQQVLLYLATASLPGDAYQVGIENSHYLRLLDFLADKAPGRDADALTEDEFATLAVLARRSFRDSSESRERIAARMSRGRLVQIADRDPSFARELILGQPRLREMLTAELRTKLCLVETAPDEGWVALHALVLPGQTTGQLRNEMAVLEFALSFLKCFGEAPDLGIIAPARLQLKTDEGRRLQFPLQMRIASLDEASGDSLYDPPSWCEPNERWRFSLGYLVRFILSGHQDFTQTSRAPSWKAGKSMYRSPSSHWYQRRYGLYNGHLAFGDDWLPISDWIEKFLSALLSWPGCKLPEGFEWAVGQQADAEEPIRHRLEEIRKVQGASGDPLMLRLRLPKHYLPQPRPLRACIVQTVVPNPSHFTANDLTLSAPAIRREHRNHLSKALATVGSMLELRDTHGKWGRRLDWLILPELSVHPDDVKTHLVPFARKHKCMILAGLTYQQLPPFQFLVNSALWVIPNWSPSNGWQMTIRRQGKQYLTRLEESLNQPTPSIMGFRPSQWLIGYEWSSDALAKPLWLTAAVCYDATDLGLASDLRTRSDVFAIPASNQDTNTFDQMAQALHYHMFQLVIIANNGLYGGSNAYAPYKNSYERKIFHLYGQPQATMAFIEIDDIEEYLNRKEQSDETAKSGNSAKKGWKAMPAGMK